jgi:hypothetical protein
VKPARCLRSQLAQHIPVLQRVQSLKNFVLSHDYFSLNPGLDTVATVLGNSKAAEEDQFKICRFLPEILSR